MAMIDDFDRLDPVNGEFYEPARLNFAAYVQGLRDEECGVGLREGWVPCSQRWLVDGRGAVVGVTRVRHRIDTPFLWEYAGHIGYDVAPSHRGRGHGHDALQIGLAVARSIDLQRVLILTGEGNRASRRVIERQGGQLEAVAFSEFWGEQLCRYWVNVLGQEAGEPA